VDIFLAAAGVVAFRAYRIVGWTIAHPISLLVILGLFLGLATGLWYSAVVILAFAPVIYGSRELRSNRYRRALNRRGVESAPPPPGDLPAAPVVAAVILVAFAALISLPQEWLTVALRTVTVALAATILVGWKAGYVIFRPQGPILNKLSEALPLGQWRPARASGRLLTRDAVFEVRVANQPTLHTVLVDSDDPARYAPALVRLEPVMLLNAPGGSVPYKGRPLTSRLALVTPSRKAALSLARPDVRSVEAGTMKLVRGQWPALRLQTVLGPLVLSFESSQARNSALRSISEGLT
jgi:hypothetical protein